MRKLDLIHKQTVEIYQKHAKGWDTHRPRVLFERYWLDRFSKLLPRGGRILDVGCGAGEPIARYLLDHDFHVTGLDASERMLEISRSRFPEASWVHMDMRDLELEARFAGIISWDSFFHLNQDEQRKVLPLFAAHLNPQGALLLTIGHEAGEVIGTVEGAKVYHSSLAIDEYEAILRSAGFTRFEFKLEDESCGFHSVLLAQRS